MLPTQDRVLKAIASLTAQFGYAPSLDEIAGEIGIAKSTTHHHLTKLQGLGLVSWNPKKNRTLRLRAAS